MKYLYIPETGLGDDIPSVRFEAESNVILARRQAEREYGKGGLLFIEIPPSPDPVGIGKKAP
ncbi:MAG: hypothetical protein US41_C0023G0004 [Parcubacteria group bacterium GW2011_GWB1_37_13]|nr:MAG: hypothetical protein US41_C0023G0004 [Parcubacteria group bacterium GW2011_GWB1_37_13]